MNERRDGVGAERGRENPTQGDSTMIKAKDFLNKDIAKGIAIGAGITAVGLLLIPAFRPVTRSAVKSGILLYEKGREWVAEANEQLEDLVAEVRMELSEAAAMETVLDEAGQGTDKPVGAEGSG
jgi:hypothetical protein